MGTADDDDDDDDDGDVVEGDGNTYDDDDGDDDDVKDYDHKSDAINGSLIDGSGEHRNLIDIRTMSSQHPYHIRSKHIYTLQCKLFH